MALQIRRGIESERTAVTFAEGELVYITDTDKLYIGDNTTVGGIEIGPKTYLFNYHQTNTSTRIYVIKACVHVT